MGDPAKLSLEDLVRHTRGQVDRLKQSGEHNPALQELDKLIKASDEQVKRLEDWRHGKHPLNFFQRVRRHVGRHSRSLGDVAFAGVLLALAIERLSEKNTVKVRINIRISRGSVSFGQALLGFGAGIQANFEHRGGPTDVMRFSHHIGMYMPFLRRRKSDNI